jgi:hypothetical protein
MSTIQCSVIGCEQPATADPVDVIRVSEGGEALRTCVPLCAAHRDAYDKEELDLDDASVIPPSM